MTVKELYAYIAGFAPAALSAEWDNDGIACCTNEARPVRRVLVALDATEAVADKAIAEGFDVLLTHHPLLFRGVKALTPIATVPRKLLKLIKADVTAMSFHTRLDAAEGGVNDVLAHTLGLENVQPFGPAGEEMGRIGDLPQALSAAECAKTVCEKLDIPTVLLAGDGTVRRVAVLGGEGGDFVSAAKAAGADLFVSGRIGYHRMLDGAEEGIALIEAGHFATEVAICDRLAAIVAEADASIEVEIYKQPAIVRVER